MKPNFNWVFLIIFLTLWHSRSQAANFYWKGGSGDFNDASKWWVGSFGSGTTASQSPISTDHVFFMAAAFTSPSAIIQINSSASCQNLFFDPLITTTNAPTLRGTNSSVNFDVYGDFLLCPNMNWQFNGNLRLKSIQTAGTPHLIQTAGKRLLVNSMVIDAAELVEYRLVDDLWVDDPAQSANNITQGSLYLNGGYLNTNARFLRLDGFTSINNNPKRRLNISNSRITVNHYHTTEYSWNVDFNATLASPNFAGFQSAGSHIIQNGTDYCWVRLGIGIRYDSLSFERYFAAPTDDFRPYTYINTSGQDRDTVEHLFVNRRVAMIYDANRKLIAKNLYLYPDAYFSAYSSSKILEVENIITPLSCDKFATLGVSAANGWYDQLTIRKISPGVLNMNNLIFGRVVGDMTGGRTYVATNSLDRGGNSNLNISGSTSRELFFKDVTNTQDWHNLNNWQEWTGSNFIPVTCLPTPFDNVYFDGNSFPNTNKRVQFLSRAYCKNMRWQSTIPTGAQLRAGNVLQVFGSLEYDPKMTFGTAGLHRQIMLCGKNPDSLISKGAINNSISTVIESYASYHIVGNYTGLITGGWSSRMIMQADTLRPTNAMQIHFGEFNGTQIYISNGSWSLNLHDHGPAAITYTGNATVHWTHTGAGGTYSFYGGYLPNLIVYGRINVSYHNIYIRGNLTLRPGAVMYVGNTQVNGTTNAALRIIGGLNGATGNLRLEAGSQMILTSFGGTNSLVNIAGNLDILGNCTQNVFLGTHDGNVQQGGFSVAGTTNIQYAYLQGLRNISPAPNANINAINSTDGGNNTAWTFSLGPGQTYYWRAKYGNPSNFVGNWSDPGHWTTNPASPTGDSLCVPSGADDVIFDAQSLPTIGSQSCTVTGTAYCRDLSIQSAARLIIGTASLTCRNFTISHTAARFEGSLGQDNSPSQLYIKGSLEWASNMSPTTGMLYRGDINMVGSGSIRSNGTKFQARALIFNSPTGVWNLQDSLFLDNDWGTTNSTNRRAGELRMIAGTLNTNDHNLYISSYFNASSTTFSRSLNMGNSTIVHRATAWYYIQWTPWLWNVAGTNFSLSFGPNARILFAASTTFNTSLVNTRLDYYMGNISYPQVRIMDADQPVSIYGNANYRYLELEANAYVDGNNSFDSLRFEGGYFYRFRNASTQTLRAPHGKIISNGTGSSFVNIESSLPGSSFTLRKPFGPAFCIDFVKVKDCVGTKETNTALIPASYLVGHPFLEFQTGVNSDNIGGTATGIWAFSLPPLVTPQRVGPNSISICRTGAVNYMPLQFTGTSPYQIDYTWTDASNNTGSGVIVFNDNDNNPSTPYTYPLSVTSIFGPIQYSINTRTSRCGELTPSSLSTVTVNLPSPNILVSVPRTANCDFNNEGQWLTMIDPIENKPIVSLRDSVNGSDLQALGNVTAQVFFDPTVQYYNDGFENYPYLQRHWQISPANNGPALVRLYFTQAELAALGLAGLYNPSLNPAVDIQVRKFSGNGVGLGSMVIVPHTVIPLTGPNALPFTSTANVIAVEFEVSSFSHFIITPTLSAMLPLTLLHFGAQANEQLHVHTHWQVAQELNLSHYEVERTQNFQQIQSIGQVSAQNQALAQYEFTDVNPWPGQSYYRLRSVDQDGSSQYSPWAAVQLPGAQPLAVYPNPTKQELNVRMLASQEESVWLQLYDGLGRLVWSQSFSLTLGYSTLNAQLPALSPGLYQLQIQTGQTGSIFTQSLQIE